MTKARHLGIFAVSAEGAALCYRTICVEGAASFGTHGHPEVTLHTYPLAEYVRDIECGRWEEVGKLLLSSAHRLLDVGAELLLRSCWAARKSRFLSETDSELPAIDSTRTLARAALRESLSASPVVR